MPFIAARLNADGLRPLKAAQYTWHSVQDLLRSAVYHDRSTPRGLALYLKEQGHSLREICVRAGAGRALSEARRSVVSADGEAADGQLVVSGGRLLFGLGYRISRFRRRCDLTTLNVIELHSEKWLSASAEWEPSGEPFLTLCCFLTAVLTSRK